MKCKTKVTKISNEINRNYSDIKKQIVTTIQIMPKSCSSITEGDKFPKERMDLLNTRE